VIIEKASSLEAFALVATWNLAANSTYYSRQRETDYYAGSDEPDGIWYAPTGDFGVVHGSAVNRTMFERLYAAVGADGRVLLDDLRRHKERVPAFDITLSAPRSVSLAWAFASYDTKLLIEAAQQRAVEATLAMLEGEASFARRGRNGTLLEKVPLTAATFRHGESRPAVHADGRTFGDPNLHTHCVVLNLATRRDRTVGALHSKVLRDFKMAAGATYHAALAHELQRTGFAIDRIGKNGIFELAHVDATTIDYFSARRTEIQEELAEHGVSSAEAVALASAVAKATRSAKRHNEHARREETWADAAKSIGLDVQAFTESLRDAARGLDREAAERLFLERLTLLPSALTEHESVVDRRDLIRTVAASLVGTGLPVERAGVEVERLISRGAVIEIGRDAIGVPRYSTPEMLSIERQVVEIAQDLARRSWPSIEKSALVARCRGRGLSAEQIAAVVAAANANALAIIEGAPGSGKTTILGPLVDSYREKGYRVLGTATAWRVATMLRDDLSIEARATASWIAKLRAGEAILDKRTVLIADEAGLLSAREMHTLLDAVAKAGAKLVLVGDRKQLQAIGAGPGLALVARAVEAARVDTIVRQWEPWARQAVSDFGAGRASAALKAFSDRNLVVEAHGAKATIVAVVDWAEVAQATGGAVVVLAKTNAAVASISREVRGRHKAANRITGKEIEFTAATPSGHPSQLQLARGDKIRFLVRDNELGVINGTIATVTRVGERGALTGRKLRIEAEFEGKRTWFDPMRLADPHGRPRLGWAYASTIAGAQGLTVDKAVVLVDPAFNRHDIFVAASRAREQTTLVFDGKAVDRRLADELAVDRQGGDFVFSGEERRVWLAERLSRAAAKVSTLDVIESTRLSPFVLEQAHQRQRESGLSHEL
jgi:conjugative relaxase-like TrwC/TraI family protein